MKKIAATLAAGIIAVTLAAPAEAAPGRGTATANGTTASTVGIWRAPATCGRYRIAYSNLAPDGSVALEVYNATTRAIVGSTYVTSTAPRSGATSVQICYDKGQSRARLVLGMKLSDGTAAESAPFSWMKPAH